MAAGWVHVGALFFSNLAAARFASNLALSASSFLTESVFADFYHVGLSCAGE